MPSSSHWLRKLRHEDHGVVISVELVSVATVALVGMVVGLTSVRDAAISEFSDIAGSVQDINQSYLLNQSTGHSAATAGSLFADASDHCDDAEDATGGIDNCIVFSAPENEDQGIALSVQFEAEGSDVAKTTGGPDANGWNLWSNGQLFVDVDIPEDGDYEFCSRLWGSHGGPDLPNAAFLVDGIALTDFDIVPENFADADVHCVDVSLTAGSHQFGIAFTNDYYAPPIDRNLFVDWLSIMGPN